jgi:hypothetical protein
VSSILFNFCFASASHLLAYGALFSDDEDGGSEEEVEEEVEEEREVEVEVEEEITEEEVVEEEVEEKEEEEREEDMPPRPSIEPSGGQSDLMKALQAKLAAKGGPGLKKVPFAPICFHFIS